MFLLVVLLAIAVVVMAAGLREQRRTIQELRSEKEDTAKAYRWLRGWDIRHGSYTYLSLDGGQHWFAISEADGGVVVTGLADMEHVRQIQATRRLFDHVAAHGPIDPGTDDVSLLTAAGFTVTKQDKLPTDNEDR